MTIGMMVQLILENTSCCHVVQTVCIMYYYILWLDVRIMVGLCITMYYGWIMYYYVLWLGIYIHTYMTKLSD